MKKDDFSRALALLRQGDWEAAHRIVQRDEESPLACWAHGIVHLMEGDTSNADEIAALSNMELPTQRPRE